MCEESKKLYKLLPAGVPGDTPSGLEDVKDGTIDSMNVYFPVLKLRFRSRSAVLSQAAVNLDFQDLACQAVPLAIAASPPI